MNKRIVIICSAALGSVAQAFARLADCLRSHLKDFEVLPLFHRAVERIVSATASPVCRPEQAKWRVVERMCSAADRESLNIFGRSPRSTGALSSPMLS